MNVEFYATLLGRFNEDLKEKTSAFGQEKLKLSPDTVD